MPTDEEVLDELDPEWRARFAHDVDRAAEFYMRYAPKEWVDTVMFLNGG